MLRFILLFVILASVSPATAGPSGLIVIPTADVREPGTYEIELQHDGEEGIPFGTDGNFLNTQYGLLNRLEAGIDFALSGDTPSDALLNYKYGFPIGQISAAFGTYNIGSGSKPISYFITGGKTSLAGLHLGAQRTNGEIQLLAGAHRGMGRFTLMADYTSGEGNFGSAGFEYALSDRFAVLWGALFPNDDEETTQLTLHIIYNNRF